MGVWVGVGRGLVVGMTDEVGPALRPRLPTAHSLNYHAHARTELNLALVAVFMPSLPVVTFYSSHMFDLSVGQVREWLGWVERAE